MNEPENTTKKRLKSKKVKLIEVKRGKRSDHPITCHKCGYNWFTLSEMYAVSCPSCKNNVKNPYAKYLLK